MCDDGSEGIRYMDNRIEDKIDKISDRLNSIDVTLAKNTVSLEEHIKRTNLLEEEVKPIKKHVDMIEGALKLIGVLAMIAAIIETIHTVFK